MAKIRVFLDKDETPDDVDESLFKALNLHRSGDQHTEDFTDPAMKNLANKMKELHEKMYANMLEEIFEELNKEYSDGYLSENIE